MEALKCPWLPIRPMRVPFSSCATKRKTEPVSAARHLGLSAHPAPGGLEGATSQSWERFRASCCPKAQSGPPKPCGCLWGKGWKGWGCLWGKVGCLWKAQLLFWVNLFQFASINQPGSWSGQAGDYLMGSQEMQCRHSLVSLLLKTFPPKAKASSKAVLKGLPHQKCHLNSTI